MRILHYFLLIFLFLFLNCESEKAPDYSELLKKKDERINFLGSKGEFNEKTLCYPDSCLTNLFHKSLAKTTQLGDYNSYPDRPFLVACFPTSFLPFVPDEIIKELIRQRILPNNVTLCWNVQSTVHLGVDPRADAATTRLKAHGWVSPDAPTDNELKGDLVNRNFLFGLYEPDEASIGDADVKINKLLPFPVHTHQTIPGSAPISPPNMAKVALTYKSPSQSFWSLVVDSQPPKGKAKRAAITLHWALKQEIVGKNWGNSVEGQFRKLKIKHWQEDRPSLKEVIKQLKNNHIIGKDRIMKSLQKLLADTGMFDTDI